MHSDIFENYDKLVSKNMQSDRYVIACSTAEASSHKSTSSTTGARCSEIVSFAAGAHWWSQKGGDRLFGL